MNLYPLKFHPILKEKIWGGTRLEKYGKEIGSCRNIGESWELSGLGSDVSIVSNGQLADNELNDLIEIYMGDIVGDSVYELFGNQFPLLFKLIDANHDLSIQVHPNDETAFERHQCMGKREMWYVLHADEGSFLTAGFKRQTNEHEYQEALANGSVEELLQKVPVKRGDVLFVDAGLVHSIGKGVVLAEIQQSSDITYRIYDFNRIDKTGKKRELHIDMALDVINFEAHNNPLTPYQQKTNAAVNLTQCPYFTTNLISFERTIERDYAKLDSFVVYMCVEGTAMLEVEGEQYSLSEGETILIPAVINAVEMRPQHGSVKLLEVYMDHLDEI